MLVPGGGGVGESGDGGRGVIRRVPLIMYFQEAHFKGLRPVVTSVAYVCNIDKR